MNWAQLTHPMAGPPRLRGKPTPQELGAVQSRLMASLVAIKANYSAAQSNRFRRMRTGISSTGSGADYHLRDENQYLELIEYARDMDRNDTVVQPIADRVVNNVIQDGFRLDPQSGSKDYDDAVKGKWENWSCDPQQVDVSGRKNFHDIERIVYRSARLIDGDAFVLPRQAGSLQILEAHRCRSMISDHTRVLGVRMNDLRQPLQYYFTKDDIDPWTPISSQNDLTPYEARGPDGEEWVFHIVNPTRISQTRGVTALAPVFDSLGYFEDINFAKLVQANVVSAITFIIKHLDTFTGETLGQLGARSTSTIDDLERQIEQIGAGTVITAPKGTEIQPFSPSVPNPEYFEHAKLTLQLICSCLNIPLMVYLLDSSITNFSGWRGAIDQARIGWKHDQKWFTGQFHSKVYRWKVSQWLRQDAKLAGLVTQDVNPYAHKFIPPTWPYIEPSKEAAADKIRIDNRLTSPRRAHAERGQDYAEVINETVDDNAEALKLAVSVAERLKVEFDRDVDPMHLLKLNPDRALSNVEAQDPLGSLKGQLEAYGVAVRAGALTPQMPDEEHFRGELGLPPMSDQTKEDWTRTGTRKPITLAADEDGGDVPTGPVEDNDGETG